MAEERKPMPPSRRIVLYGNSIALAGIALNCAKQTGLEIVTIDTGDPAAAQRLQELATDVVIFDLAESRADLTISLLRERAGLLLLGVDPSRNEMLVLSGHPERVLSTQDLLQVVNRKVVAQTGEPKEELLSRRKPSIVHNIFQSKRTRFIAGEEPEMKNLSKRNQIILAIAAVVVVVVVAVVVFFQASGEDLFGTLIDISISPSSSTVAVGRSQTLSSSTSLSNCSWSSSNTSVASITSSSTKSATVRANAAGTATISEKCGALGRYKGSATVTVVAAPAVNPSSVRIFYPYLYTPTSATLNSGTGSVTWSIVSCVDYTGSAHWSPSSVLSLSTTTGPSVVVSSPNNPMPYKCVIQASVGGATSQATVCDNWEPNTSYTVSCP
jgi:hypothetical protein